MPAINNISTIIDVLSAVTAAIALSISIVTWHQGRGTSVREFFEQGNSASMKHKRKILYDLENKYIGEHKSDDQRLTILRDHAETVTSVISFYDTWGLLLKKGYLPIWVFDGAAGEVARNIYKIVLPYINYRQCKDAELSCKDYLPHYGEHFKYLIKKLLKRQS